MLFPQVEYMHWAKTVPGKYPYNLAASGIDFLATREELELTVDDIQLGGNNFYGYPRLRAAISARYNVPEKNILITQGTSLANVLVAAAILEQGDSVLVERPAYEPLLTIFEPLLAKVERLVRRPEQKYAIDLDELRNCITPKTKLVLVSTLHNPSGVRIPADTLREIAAIVESNGATLVVDEVYQDFLSASEPTAFSIANGVVTTSSLTKVYGLGGLRVGWVFADENVVKNAYHVYNNLGVNNCFPGDHIAAVLMERGCTERVAARARTRAAEHWAIVNEWLATRTDLATVTPDGGLTCFPRFVDGRSATAFNQFLQERFDTTVVPGKFFEDDRGFRLGFGCDGTTLGEGLSRLGEALDTFIKR